MTFYEVARRMDYILRELVTPDIETELLTIIDSDDSYLRYFLKRASNVAWFIPLKEAGYFSADRNPHPKPSDEEGHYSIPEWNVLPYLERVSQQVSTPGNEKYVDNLLKIIKDVSNYTDSTGQHIDNYRTWWYFSKILLNLPIKNITVEIIDLIPIWLDSRFNTSLPGKEIAVDLLQKFLTSENTDDWKKAERLIEIITDIKWVPLIVAQKDLNDREDEAVTVIEPYWLRAGFEKSFARIGRVCSISVVETMAKKILGVFCRQYPSQYDIDCDGKRYEISHALLEDGNHQVSVNLLKVPEDENRLFRRTLERTIVTEFIVSDVENQAAFVVKVKEGLVLNNVPILLSPELDNAVASIYFLRDYTYIGYNSLNASPDRIHVEDNERILLYILKEILAEKARYDREEVTRILDKFLSRAYPFPFFKRLVLFVVSKEWEKYREVFISALNIDELRFFEKSDYATELSGLLKANVGKFSPDEKDLIRGIIESGPHWVPDENPDKYRAQWKTKWLFRMKDDPTFARLFEEMRELAGINQEASFTSGAEVNDYEERSPLSADEILNLTNDELSTKLKEFKSEKKLTPMTVGAFAGSLKEAVKLNPGKFTDNLSAFDEVGFIYACKILDGLKDVWKENKTIVWGKVFDFIALYISKEGFWQDEYVVEPGSWPGEAGHGWVASSIAELIQEGTSDDAWAFSEAYFDSAREIVLKLFEVPDEKDDVTDYVFRALNTPCGKLLTAMVYLALRIARVNDKKGINKVPRWAGEFKNKFDELLTVKVTDAYTSLGRLLPYLAYLDKKWVEEKIAALSSATDSREWLAFFEGYLSIGRVYDDIFDLMKPHYLHGLSIDFQEKRNLEHLVQHVSIGYLRGREGLDDPNGLFRKVIEDWKPEMIRGVTGFFWMQRDFVDKESGANEGMRDKILGFWKILCDKYKALDEESYTKTERLVLSDAGKLAGLLPQITAESCDWLILSAPYVDEDFNSSFFIEYLDVLKGKGDRSTTAKCIGKVYLRMLDRITPDHREEHIRSTVEFLYAAGEIENANKICNIYGSWGNDFLRDLYEKNTGKGGTE